MKLIPSARLNILFIISMILTWVQLYSDFFIVSATPRIINVGAVFVNEQKGSIVELLFKYAVYCINKDRDILPQSQLVYNIQYVDIDDTFSLTEKVCHQLKSGIQVIFGPTNKFVSNHVQYICQNFQIPYITNGNDLESKIFKFSIALHPSFYYLNLAYRDILQSLNWTKLAIVYDKEDGIFFEL